MRQKFFHGDEVRIAKKLRASMSHFPANQNAIVIGSYDDLHGDRNGGEPEYSLLLLKEEDEVSWYPESTLVFVKRHTAKQVRKIRERIADKQFDAEKKEMAKEGLVPDGNSRNMWKRVN